jgi:hypothetical protein
MVRPSVPSKRHFMSASAQENAALTLVVSSKALEGVQGWLSGLRPSSWSQTASLVSNRAGIEIDNLDSNVLDQLDSDEGEETAKLLRSKWQSLRDDADDALFHPPSWLTSATDKVSVFIADFTQGAQAAWQSYASTALEYSGPVLRQYYDSTKRLMELQSDLVDARSSGKFTEAELSDQAAKINEAEALLNRARSTFNTLSGGGSLDDVAQKTYGSYMGAIPAGIMAAIILVAVAVVIYTASSAIGKISDLIHGPETPGGASEAAKGISTGMLGLVLLLVIPFFIMKD